MTTSAARKELDLALMAITATRRQVNRDLDAIEARIRRALPSPKSSRSIGKKDKAYYQDRFKDTGVSHA